MPVNGRLPAGEIFPFDGLLGSPKTRPRWGGYAMAVPAQSSARHAAHGNRPDLNYVPALDGVRGVAVLTIMGYHGGVFLTSGGYYSLDTFFALSGFLITTLLVAEWQQSATVRLGRFWARRARRLLPALILLVVAVLLFARYAEPPGMYPGLRGDAFSTLFYVANWHFIVAGSNYFAQTGATSPLLHTWSLAVEEQFYLVWPLVVLLVLRSRLGLRGLLFVCVGGALASAAAMAVLASPATQNRVYYGTDTRAQSLLVGAALAVGLTLAADRRKRLAGAHSDATAVTSSPGSWLGSTRRVRLLFGLVGIAGVLGTALLWTTVSISDAVAFRGGFLLAALATTCVLANIVVSPSSVVPRCLAFSPLRYVGRISYGMYLWHFPIFLWLDAARSGVTGFPLFVIRVACTLLVANVSYYAVERPIRQRRLLKTWAAWVATPVTVAGAVVVVLLATTTAPVTAAPTAFHPPADHTTGLYAGTPVRLLIVGDSTALTMGLGLATYAHDYNVRVDNAGILGCGITDGAEYQLKGVDAPMDSSCTGARDTPQWQAIWRDHIAQFRPNVVLVLAGRWEVANRTYQGHWTNISNPTYASYVHRQLVSADRIARSGGAKVMLLTAPCYDTGEQPDGQAWPEDSPSRLSIYNALVRTVAAASPDTTLVDFNAMACPSGRYETYIDHVDARYDGVHFTLGGGVVFGPTLLPLVEKLGRQQMAGGAAASSGS